MANITIRNIPDNTKESLRVQAAMSGISLEAYARQILQQASTTDFFRQPGVLELAGKYFGSDSADNNGSNLELPSRSSSREEVKFEK